jgi:hydroxymethylpyrimidine/phosphomethylpyrimidine kinase
MASRNFPVALTLGNTDPTGVEGIQADLKTFHQRGVYGLSIVAAVTIQNSRDLAQVETLSADVVAAQLDHLLRDVTPHAAKAEGLVLGDVVEAVAERAARVNFPWVLDAAATTRHGAPLAGEAIRQTLMRCLFPHTFLLVVDATQASSWSGRSVHDLASLIEAARALVDLGPRAVLIKGSRRVGGGCDVLYDGTHAHAYQAVQEKKAASTAWGSTYSAAVTAELAKGKELAGAVSQAKKYVTRAIEESPDWGSGMGPVNHRVEI